MAGNVDIEAFRQQLEALRQEYRQQLQNRVTELEGHWQRFAETGDAEDLETLHRKAHALTGTAATFELAAVAGAAAALEGGVRQIREGGQAPAKDQVQGVVNSLKALAQAVESLPIDSPAAPSRAVPVPPPTEENLVILVVDDAAEARELASQLAHYGYRVRTLDGLAELATAIAQDEPLALVTDIRFQAGELAGAAAVQALQAQRETQLRVVFLSSPDSYEARLQAVRAGGVGYFCKPVDVSALVARLDVMRGRFEPDPFRVLIVDDDATVAAHYGEVLRQAGLLTRVAGEPRAVLSALTEFRPELILMDLYMPGCSGLELAAMIRQLDDYVAIPIVYLSVERDIRRQMAAIQRGGDDFLTKPIEAHHLLDALGARLRRFRLLRALMVRDGLTGLYTHTHIKEALRNELLRAQRRGAPVALAMLDLDHFKQVNDSHGHAAGDQVLRDLARLLGQRLRKTDLVGRYGGEEFAIVLPETDTEAALRVLEGIRESFSQIKHRVGAAEFRATLSCGVASYPTFTDEARLTDAADAALYRAKREGRNRVVVAQPSTSATVVVIDDEPKLTQLLQAILEQRGWRVLVSHNGLAGLELVARERPDLVISDVLLPGLSGFELCKRVKSEESLRHIPVLLMTAVYKKSRYRYEAKEYGADGFLEKPFDPASLLEIVDQVRGPDRPMRS